MLRVHDDLDGVTSSSDSCDELDEGYEFKRRDQFEIKLQSLESESNASLQIDVEDEDATVLNKTVSTFVEGKSSKIVTPYKN